MNAIGTVLGSMTIVMVLCKPLAALAALLLILAGEHPFVFRALALLVAGIAVSFAIDALRWLLALPRQPASPVIALARAVVPTGAILVWEYAVFTMLGGPDLPVLHWLVAYVSATGFLSVRARLAVRDMATQRALESYAGQLAFLICGLAIAPIGWPLAFVLPLAAFPAILPIGMTFMVARTDPLVLRDVQV